MTWQEELGQLDRKLAAGQISADDYRRQRDRILAAASGGQQAATEAAPAAPESPAHGIEQQQMPQQAPQAPQQQQPQQPQQNAEGRAPFAPPFRWEAVPPNEPTQAVGQRGAQAEPTQVVGSGDGEKTQIVSSSDTNADRTQVVPNAAGQPGPSERTQHIPAIGANQQPPQPMHQQGQPQQQQQGGWSPQQESANPWGNPDEPLSLWAPGFHQGPEVFETTPAKKSKKVPVIIAVVVVVALAAAAVLYFTVFKKGSNPEANTPPQTTTTAPTSTAPPAPRSFGALAIPDGHTGAGKNYTAAQIASTKPLPTPDLVLLKQHGVTQAQSVVGSLDSSTVSLWSFRSKDAKKLLDAILDDQQRFGFSEAPDLKQGEVKVFKSEQKSSTGSTIVAYRAHYVSGDDVIRVEAYDKDETAAKANFTSALTAQLKHNPPA